MMVTRFVVVALATLVAATTALDMSCSLDAGTVVDGNVSLTHCWWPRKALAMWLTVDVSDADTRFVTVRTSATHVATSVVVPDAHGHGRAWVPLDPTGAVPTELYVTEPSVPVLRATVIATAPDAVMRDRVTCTIGRMMTSSVLLMDEGLVSDLSGCDKVFARMVAPPALLALRYTVSVPDTTVPSPGAVVQVAILDSVGRVIVDWSTAVDAVSRMIMLPPSIAMLFPLRMRLTTDDYVLRGALTDPTVALYLEAVDVLTTSIFPATNTPSGTDDDASKTTDDDDDVTWSTITLGALVVILAVAIAGLLCFRVRVSHHRRHRGPMKIVTDGSQFTASSSTTKLTATTITDDDNDGAWSSDIITTTTATTT